jgi:hypothetical protein
MNFQNALDDIKNGGRVRRAGWNGKNMELLAVRGENVEISTLPHGAVILDFILMRTVDGSYVPWLASQTDLLADDWERVPFKYDQVLPVMTRNPPTGLFCGPCAAQGMREPQVQTPSGPTCKYGHGGADGVP